MSDEIKNLLLPEVSYRHLIADHPMQVMELDLNGTILFANRLDHDIASPWREGLSLPSLLSEEDRTDLEKAIDTIRQGSRTAYCQVSLAHKAGGGMRHLIQIGPLYSGSSNPGLLAIVTPIRTTRSSKPDDIVHPATIRSHLLTALLSNETIDIQIDNLTDTFNTLLLPFPPRPAGSSGPKQEQDFLPGSYLGSMTHLLLCPLEPAYGNVRIRKANEITLTFHSEDDAFRGPVTFHQVMAGQDGHALKTSFPQVLEPFKRRQSKRVRVPMGMSIRLLINVENGRTLDTLLGDISAYGLSFFYPQGMDPLTSNTEVSLNLNISGNRFLELHGVICNQQTSRDGSNPYALRKKGGVEFYPLADNEAQDRLNVFLDRLDKNFKFFLENKQKKYAF
ncbi:MAG: hypothetical protein G8345_16425 [Magnetococcales bacterium]|nr:PilZ domain-containing protein [Magnetococcales bacterium]NGZ28462.1 hypothetical protein [Magnetococcales bacterium]